MTILKQLALLPTPGLAGREPEQTLLTPPLASLLSLGEYARGFNFPTESRPAPIE